MSSPSDARLHEVIAAYLDAAGRGQAPSREEWLGQHPDLAERLGRFLDNQRWLHDQTTLAAPAAPQRVRYVGDYEVLGEIARGGMGVVYLAHDTRLGRDVAIKALPRDLPTDERRRERLRREARALREVERPSGKVLARREAVERGRDRHDRDVESALGQLEERREPLRDQVLVRGHRIVG